MKNGLIATRTVKFEIWADKSNLKKGFISVYDEEPFDDTINSPAYEIGRQTAILAKARGYKTKGVLLRRKPKSTQYAWVKTKINILQELIMDLGWDAKRLVIR